MIHQQLLRRAVAGRSPALVDFVETVAPRLLERFTTIPALGGSGRLLPLDPRLPPGIARFTEEEMARFGEKNPDQSLTAHILNGLFAGLRLAEWLPAEKALSDLEQRLWILGYVVHDYTKVYGIKVQAGQLDVIREVIRYLGQDLAFDAYFADWPDYLDDIVFLAQNTQKVEGANLNLRDYRLKTPPRRLDVLRYLSSYADVLVHIKSPSDVTLPETSGRNTDENLRKMLDDLFGSGRAPRLTYHKLSDVRGLLSNLIHNAVMMQLKAQGYEPYLFFTNGVVYLADGKVSANINPQEIAREVWTKVVEALTEDEEFGIKRVGKDGLKVAPPLYELLTIRELLDLGIGEAMRIANSYAAERLYGFDSGKSKEELQGEFGDQISSVCEDFCKKRAWPCDVRVDILAEFLIFVKRRLFSHLFGQEKQADNWLLKTLQLQEVPLEDATRSIKGGTLTGWFYAASQFVKAKEVGEPETLRPVLQRISEDFLDYVDREKLAPKIAPRIEQDFTDYMISILEIDGKLANDDAEHSRFRIEFENYRSRKAKRRPVCSMCSSPYGATEQADTVVLWLAQQYSNKNPLNTTEVKRGICSICTIEMMLRSVLQGAPSKRFQDQKPLQLYLYPTYFFTLETERVAKSFLAEMADINIFPLRQHLRSQGFSVGAFLRFDGFLSDGSRPRRGVLTPLYRQDEPAGLVFGSLSPLGRDPTDTDSWAIPALLAVGIPLLLDVKVVATPSFTPLFSSGADFRETTILDGPHTFTSHLWGKDRFRVDELEAVLIKLLNLYDLHLGVFAEGYDPHWPQLNAVAKDIATDPYYTFSYYERKEHSDSSRQRKKKKGQSPSSKGISSKDLERYFEIYQVLGGKADMGIIGEIVDAYAAFYRARYGKLDSAYAVLKPFTEAADVLVESLSRTQDDDLVLLVEGAIHDLMNRVWDDPQTDGWDPIVMVKDENTKRDERKRISRQKQAEFAQQFVAKLFHGYCNGDRATLREQLKRLRPAARFYYVQKYGS